MPAGKKLDSQQNARFLTERSKLLEWRWVPNMENHGRLLASLESGQPTQALGEGIPLRALSFAPSTRSSQEWPALDWQRDAECALAYSPMKPGEESPKLTFSDCGLRRSETGSRLIYTENEHFNRYGPRPEK